MGKRGNRSAKRVKGGNRGDQMDLDRNLRLIQNNIDTEAETKAARYVKDPVEAKNDVQQVFLDALRNDEIQCVVFMAPAGVGKSFLTMSELTDWYKKKKTEKILLSRPAVGMGKTLGLLKGGMREKYEPYLLPMVDVITDRYGYGFYETCLSNKSIEMVPLEYIRGRNIKDVAVVDEFQNSSADDAYTMITRIAETGKLILIGDPTQKDVQGKSGLEWLKEFLEENPSLKRYVKLIEATSDDIVRGGMCKMMVQAKEKSKISK